MANEEDKMVLRMPYPAYVKMVREKNSCRRTVRLSRELDMYLCKTARDMNLDPCSCIRHLIAEGIKSRNKMR